MSYRKYVRTFCRENISILKRSISLRFRQFGLEQVRVFLFGELITFIASLKCRLEPQAINPEKCVVNGRHDYHSINSIAVNRLLYISMCFSLMPFVSLVTYTTL